MKQLIRLLSLSLLLTSACKQVDDLKNLKSPEYNPGLAFPLANTTFTIRDILDQFEGEEGYVSTVDDGIISVVYRGHVFTVKGSEVYDFPAIDNIPIPPTNFDFPYPSVNGAAIKRIIFKSGKIQCKIANLPNMFSGDAQVTIHFTDLKQNNIGTDIVINVPKNTTQDIPLSTRILDLADDNISVYYEAKLVSNNTAVIFPGNQLTFSMISPTYSYLQGTLPKYQFSTIPEDTVNLKIFGNVFGGNVFFKNPRINIIVKNSFGAPVRAKADVLKAKDVYNFTQDITSSYNGIFDFPYPTLSQVGQSVVDTFKFTGTNSNISSIIQQRPSQVIYKISGELNPNSVPGGFVTDSSQFDIYVDVALPMYGKTANLSFSKTFSTDFKPFKVADRASFKLITENGFPADVKAQLYFYDKNNVLLDSLFHSDALILKAAPVNANGQATTKEKSINEAVFTAEEFEKIKTATSITLKAKLNTTNNGNTDVKFYENNGMTVKLGMIIGVNVVEVIK
jgi:hypothetical protein